MPRFFLNNFSTTLSGPITNVQTTLPLQAGDGALLPQVNQPFPGHPYDEDFLLTIDDGAGNVEVVRVIDHDGSDTIDEVQRGFDGTTGLAFAATVPVEARNTDSAMSHLWANFVEHDAAMDNPIQPESVNIVPTYDGPDSGAQGFGQVVIGNRARAHQLQGGAIVIGELALLDYSAVGVRPSIVIGRDRGGDAVDSADAIAIGLNNYASLGAFMNQSVFIGNSVGVRGLWRANKSVVIGTETEANGDNCVIIGYNTGELSTEHSIILGNHWNNAQSNNNGDDFGGLVIGHAFDGLDEPLEGFARITWPRAFGGRIDLESSGDGHGQMPSYANNGTEVTLASPAATVTVANPFGGGTTTFFTWQLPTGGDAGFMFVESIEVVFGRVPGGSPTVINQDLIIDVGTTGVNSSDLLLAQNVTGGVIPDVTDRKTFVSLDPDKGYNAITITVDTPLAFDVGTLDAVYFVIRGTLFKVV